MMDDARSPAIDDALARAVLYRTLSVGFQPPTEERFHHVGARNRFSTAVAALRQLDRRGDGSPLESAAARLAAMPPPDLEATSRAFVRIFGHTARGLVCAYETEYGPDNGFHQPQQLADVAGYYLAFGLRPVTACDTRVDHIACECEFLDFLNRKIAVLLGACLSKANTLLADDSPRVDRQETLEATEHAASGFLRHHLARFGCAFATRLINEEPGGYFGALGHVLLALLEAECARLGIAPGSAELSVLPELADDAPMACGRADELIQIQRRP